MSISFSSPAARTAIFYATFYTTAAVSNPFLAIWLDAKGLNATEIGAVNALPILLMIVLNLAVGRLADRASDWRSVLVAGSVIAAITPLLLFAADSYVPILIVWALVMVPAQSMSPVLDAASLRMARRMGYDFGAIRVWGTIGFMIVMVVAGLLLDRAGPGVFVPLIVVVSLLRALAAFHLPLFRAPALALEEATAPAAAPHPLVATTARQLWRPWFVLPLIGGALLHGSHMMQMGFGALVWQRAGLPSGIIGPLWAVAPLAEIVAMLFYERMSRRFAARHLILFACVIGAVRWFGFGFEPPVWGLAILQALHVASFAIAYLGTLSFIGNWTTEGIAAEAQSFAMVLRQGVAALALTGFGWLYGIAGPAAFHAAGGMALLGAALVLASLAMMRVRNEAMPPVGAPSGAKLSKRLQ